MANPGPMVVNILFQARDQVSASIKGILGALAKLGAALAALAAYMGAKFFGDAISQAADLEKQFSILQAKTGATTEELARLKAKADEIGASDTLSATSLEAAQAMTNLAAAGLDVGQTLEAITPIIAMAKGEGLALAEAADIVTANLAGFGLAADQAGRIADVLNSAANASRTSVVGIADALSYTAASAKAASMTLEETTGAIAMMQNAGIDASRAGTALNAMLAQLADPASKVSGALNDAGIATREFTQVLALLERGGPAAEAAILAFGTEAGPALRALLAQGVSATTDLIGNLGNVEGAAVQAAGTISQNFRGAMESLSSVWDALKIQVGETLLPGLTKEVQRLASAVAEFSKSSAFESLKQALDATFTTGARVVREFFETADFQAIGTKIQTFAESIKTYMGQVRDDLGAVVQGFRDFQANTTTVIESVRLSWNLFQVGIHVAATAIAGSLTLLLAPINLLVQGFANLTGKGEAFAKRFDNAVLALAASTKQNAQDIAKNWDEMWQAAERAGKAAQQSTTTMTEAADKQAEAIKQVDAEIQKQIEAAQRKIETDAQLQAEIEKTRAALEKEAEAHGKATTAADLDSQSITALTAARDAASAKIKANNEVIQEGADAQKELTLARLDLLQSTQLWNAALEDEKAGFDGAKEAADQWAGSVEEARARVEELEAKVKAGSKAQADAEILTGKLAKANEALANKYEQLGDKAEIAVKAAERQTQAMEEEGNLRVTQLRNMSDEAKARADLARLRGDEREAIEYSEKATRLSIEADEESIRSKQDLVGMYEVQIQKLRELAEKRIAQAQTDGQVDADEQEEIDRIQNLIVQKDLEIQKTQEQIENEKNVLQVKKETNEVGKEQVEVQKEIILETTQTAAAVGFLKDAMDHVIGSLREFNADAADAVEAFQDAGQSWAETTESINALADGIANGAGSFSGAAGEIRRDISDLSAELEASRENIARWTNSWSASQTWDLRPFYNQLAAIERVKAATIAAELADAKMQLRKEKLAEAMDKLASEYDKGALSLDEYQQRLKGLEATYQDLGEENLSGLRDALQDAKDLTDDLRESAQSALEAALSAAEAAGLGSTEIEREQIKYAQTMADLEEQLAEARKAGDAQAIKDLERAIALQKKAHEAKMQQLRDELAAEEAITEERAKRDTGPAQAGGGGAGVPDNGLSPTPSTGGGDIPGNITGLAGAMAGAMDGAIQTQTRTWEDATNRMIGALDGAIQAQTQALAAASASMERAATAALARPVTLEADGMALARLVAAQSNTLAARRA